MRSCAVLCCCCGVLSSAELYGAVLYYAMLRYACSVLCCAVPHVHAATWWRPGGHLRPGQCRKAAFIAVILWGISVLIMEAFHGH